MVKIEKSISVPDYSASRLITLVERSLPDLFDRWKLDDVKVAQVESGRVLLLDSPKLKGRFQFEEEQFSFSAEGGGIFSRQSFFEKGFDGWLESILSATSDL